MTPSALCSLLGSLLPALTLTNHEGCGCDERECVAARRARRAARLAVVNALAELSGEVIGESTDVDAWLATANSVLRVVLDCRVTNSWRYGFDDDEPVLDRAVVTQVNGREYACQIGGDENTLLGEVQQGTRDALRVVLLAVRMSGEVVKPHCEGYAICGDGRATVTSGGPPAECDGVPLVPTCLVCERPDAECLCRERSLNLPAGVLL